MKKVEDKKDARPDAEGAGEAAKRDARCKKGGKPGVGAVHL